MTEFNPNHWSFVGSDVLYENMNASLVELYKERFPEGIASFGARTTMNYSLARLAYVVQHPDARIKWINRLSDLVLLKGKALDNEQLVYERYSAIWPFRDRDFVLKGEWNLVLNPLPKATWRLHSVDDVEENTKSNLVRGHLEFYSMQLTQINSLQTEVVIKMKADAKGMLPQAVKNLLQKNWGLKTLRALNDFAGRGPEKFHVLKNEGLASV